jgi:hypothetical protein
MSYWVCNSGNWELGIGENNITPFPNLPRWAVLKIFRISKILAEFAVSSF